MDCADSSLMSGAEYMRHFTRLAADKRVPLCGTFDITRNCGMSCTHCYCRGVEAGGPGMTTERIARLFDECADAGCLYALLTGGDPLLHPDFPGIYLKAKTCGMFVTVFTSATTVKDDVVGLLRDLPPRQVEVTLYGGKAETHDAITGVPGSFRQCLSGIEKLMQAGVKLGLKTILMNSNIHELDLMEDIAARYGVNFRFDACIFPRFNGDMAPLSMRVAGSAVAEKEFRKEKLASDWCGLRARHEGMEQIDSLYWCGAGITAFYVSPEGILRPCMMVRSVTYSLANGSFIDGWRDITGRMSAKKLDARSPCAGCEKKSVCGYCPGFFEMETGSEQLPSAYLCEVGAGRLARINERNGRISV